MRRTLPEVMQHALAAGPQARGVVRGSLARANTSKPNTKKATILSYQRKRPYLPIRYATLLHVNLEGGTILRVCETRSANNLQNDGCARRVLKANMATTASTSG